ncbi:Fpg/Nei family DNA glycosylase [soil metagenome]
MPEGDTIHRAAIVLRGALAGQTVRAFRTPLPAVEAAAQGLEGRTITAVEAHGKHLLIRFDDGRVLRTHMRMTGSWHHYRPGEAWRKPERRARVVIETEERVAVCFSAPEVEMLSGESAVQGGPVGRLGPDLLDPRVDLDEVVARWRSRPELPIGVAVMRQTLAAGIGNVYKSEVLFLCGIDPFARVGELEDEALHRVATTARRLLRANLRTTMRTTRRDFGGGRLWVYRKSGKPCAKCGTVIRMRRQGEDGRSTYWCEGCQGSADTA